MISVKLLCFLIERRHPSIHAGILRCVGRQPYKIVGQHGIKLASYGLKHADQEVRDAAIGMLESWGGVDSLNILVNHVETKEWLRDYIEQVIVDLKKGIG
ncbi:hypothetical protein LCGC14_0219990 [marine sediment metagenome]|uniref:HEAT repeat domain-containing protein n=1 Tax=marine sediment metagenome TaxID=412755 RepID=A0A0F9UHJ4_9ZZZZ